MKENEQTHTNHILLENDIWWDNKRRKLCYATHKPIEHHISNYTRRDEKLAFLCVGHSGARGLKIIPNAKYIHANFRCIVAVFVRHTYYTLVWLVEQSMNQDLQAIVLLFLPFTCFPFINFYFSAQISSNILLPLTQISAQTFVE